MAGIKLYIGADSRGLRKGLADNNRLIGRWITGVVRKMSRAGLRMGAALTRGLITSVKRLGFVAGGLIAGGIVKSVKEAARFEDYGVQFEALLGSAEAAKKRMDEIKEVDLVVPFDITSIADASRILEVFTKGAFASTEALIMMADAASVTPNDIKDVAFWYGRAYSMIQSGRPFGEAAMRLQEMGLISGEARNEMERLGKVKSPEATEKMMKLLNAEFEKFAGAAVKRAKTFNGIWSIFTSGMKQAFAAVGDEILPLAKKWLGELIDKIKELRSNGTLAQWGKTISFYLQLARTRISDLIKAVVALYRKMSEAAQDSSWVEVISSELEKAFDLGMQKGLDAIRKYMPHIVEIGVEIGLAIGAGMVKGLARSDFGKFLSKTSPAYWLGKFGIEAANAGEIGRIETGSMSNAALESITIDDLNKMSMEMIRFLQQQKNATPLIRGYTRSGDSPGSSPSTPLYTSVVGDSTKAPPAP